MTHESRPKAAIAIDASDLTISVKALVVDDRSDALLLTANGIAATTVDDVLAASAEELAGYFHGEPVVILDRVHVDRRQAVQDKLFPIPVRTVRR